MIDQFTRFLCDKCENDGFDSWNKTMHDGINYHGNYPNPCIYGLECSHCGHPAVTAYTSPDAAPTAIYSPDEDSYDYEGDAMTALERDPSAGTALRPSQHRDSDWSQGCVAAKGQLQ